MLPSYRAGYEKPDKRIFDRALGLVNIPIKPEEALHVGDDLNADYRGNIHIYIYIQRVAIFLLLINNNRYYYYNIVYINIYRSTSSRMECIIIKSRYI